MTMTPNPYIVSFETIILGLFNYSDIPLHNPTHQDGDSFNHLWPGVLLSMHGKRSRQIISNFANLDLPAMKGLSSRERIFLLSMSPVLSSHSTILIKTPIKEPSLFSAKEIRS